MPDLLSAAWYPQRQQQLQPLEAVAHVAARLMGEQDAASRLVGRALQQYIDGEGDDITKNLGLRARRGRRTARTQEKLRRRNELLARLMNAQSGKSGKDRAQAVVRLLAVPNHAEAVSDSEEARLVRQLQEEFGGVVPRWETVHRLGNGD